MSETESHVGGADSFEEYAVAGRKRTVGHFAAERSDRERARKRERERQTARER